MHEGWMIRQCECLDDVALSRRATCWHAWVTAMQAARSSPAAHRMEVAEDRRALASVWSEMTLFACGGVGGGAWGVSPHGDMGINLAHTQTHKCCAGVSVVLTWHPGEAVPSMQSRLGHGL